MVGKGRPHPVAWAAQMSRAIFEVALGERPATQLRKHIAPDQLTTLAIRGTAYARHPAARSATGMTRLRKIRAVRCCLVAPGTIEASAVVVGAARSHAVALRMGSRPGTWLVTAIDFR
ncbi:Rv3235 family protein [Actinomycetota bacterium]|nr:Rv3235 family protein [Actinomycetota bacterium]